MHHNEPNKMIGKPSFSPGSHWSPPSLTPFSKPLAHIPEGSLPPSPPYDISRFPPPHFSNPMGHLFALQLQREMLARNNPGLAAPDMMSPELLHMLLRQAAMRQELNLSLGEVKREEEMAKMAKVEVVKPQPVEAVQAGREEEERGGGISPPRMEEEEAAAASQEEEKVTSSYSPPVKAEVEFNVADSIKEQGLFKDQTQLEAFRNILHGVNSSTTKHILGEALGGEGGKEMMVGGGEEVEQYEDSVTSDGDAATNGQDDRKVRVRTLISEEQLVVLKTHYGLNPRPKREELESIAAKIGHPFKVVKVWFQNSRARDRREGKHLPHLPPFPGVPNSCSPPFLNNNTFPGFPGMPRLPLPFLRPGLHPPLSPLFPFPHLPPLPPSTSPHSVKSDNIDDEMEEEEEDEDDEEEEDVPLDLSNKGSTPGASPSMMERDEAEQHPMNLANYSQLPYNFTTTMLQSSSDEEDNSLLPVPAQCEICSKVFTKRSSFKRHMSDHKGRNASSSSSKCCIRRK